MYYNIKITKVSLSHIKIVNSNELLNCNSMDTDSSEFRVLYPDASIFGSHNTQTALNFLNDETPIRVISVRCFSFGVEFIVDFAEGRHRDPSMGSWNTNVFPRLNNLACVPFVIVGQYNFDGLSSRISDVGIMLLTHGLQKISASSCVRALSFAVCRDFGSSP